jgi:hypothetical protein
MNPPLLINLKHGQILDAGMKHYGEFYASPSYATELINGGMTHVDGRPGRVEIIDTLANAVQLRFVFNNPPFELAPPQLHEAA